MRFQLRTKRNLLVALVALATLLRFYHLTAPHIYDFHAWRQADSAAFVHGYLLNNLKLFSPTVDRQPCEEADAPLGQVEAELPVASYVTAVPLRLLGLRYPEPWQIRLGSIAFFAATCVYLYRLVKQLGGSEVEAFGSLAGLALSPVCIFFTRSPQPDGPALFFSVALLYHLDVYLEGRRRRQYWLSALFAVLLLLGKVSNAFMLMPALFLCIQRLGVKGTLRRGALWGWIPLVVLPTALWYLYANDFAWSFSIWGDRAPSKFSPPHILLDVHLWQTLSDRLTFEILGWPLVILVVTGYLTGMRHRAMHLACAWTVAVLLFVAISLPGQKIHVYYQLPIVPPLSVAAGFGIAELWRRGRAGWVALGAMGVVQLAIAWHTLAGTGDAGFTPYFDNDHIDAVAEGVALLRRYADAPRFVATNRHPALFYNSGRRGYFAEDTDVATVLECLETGRAKYLLVDTATETRWLDNLGQRKLLEANTTLVANGKEFDLFRFKNAGR